MYFFGNENDCWSCLVCFTIGFLGWTWSCLFGVPISITSVIGLIWEGIGEPAGVVFDWRLSHQGYLQTFRTPNSEILSTRVGFTYASEWRFSLSAELWAWDSEKGESLQQSRGSEWGWNPQRREFSGWHLRFAYDREKLPGVQTSEGSQQYDVCVSHLVEGNYHGDKHCRMRGGRIMPHKHAMKRVKLKVRCSIIRVMKKSI